MKIYDVNENFFLLLHIFIESFTAYCVNLDYKKTAALLLTGNTSTNLSILFCALSWHNCLQNLFEQN